VYDEGTGVVELHCVGHAFTMEQQGQEDDEVPAALSAASMTAMERRQSLTDTFGSKKKKRALRAAESNIISSQNIVAADTISEILTESIIGNDRKTAASSQLEADASSLPKSAMDQHREMMLPPFDASATVLKEAYPLVGGLVPRHVVRMLEEWVDSASSQMSGGGSAGDWQQRLDQDSYCQTVQDIFDLNISQLKDKKFKKGLGSLLLCDIMVRLAFQLSESSKPIVKETLEEKLSTPPPQLLRHLTDSFAVFKKSFGKSSFVSTKSLIDKLLMHIMVLILHLNDGVINLAVFTKDVNLGSVRISALAKEIGCSLVHGSKGDGRAAKEITAQIVLPLKFPEHRKGKSTNR
jgi:hypothetical protein